MIIYPSFAIVVDPHEVDSCKNLVLHVGWVCFPLFPCPNVAPMFSQNVYVRLLKISGASGRIKNQSEENMCCVDIIPAVERMLIGSYVIT